MNDKSGDDQFSPKEIARRRDAIIRNMIAMPPKKHEPIKAKKQKTKLRKKT